MNDDMTPDGEKDEEVSWEDAFAEAAQGQAEEPVHEPSVGTQTMAQPQAFPPGADAAGKVNIDFLLDIALDVTVEIGRKKILINDLLQMQQGSVITLDKMVGESFEVYINGKIMAYGEVVMINEKFGIRLTDIVDPKERIEKLA